MNSPKRNRYAFAVLYPNLTDPNECACASFLQKLAISTRDHEASARETDALRGELALFKSVAVPFAGKPRTNMTRVKRMPFAPVNKQIATINKKQIVEEEDNKNYDDLARYLPDPDAGDMTLDELS